MMEDDGLGLALARATELRFTIANCIHRAVAAATSPPQRADANDEGSSFTSPVLVNEEDDGETEEEEEEEAGEAEAEVLFNICDVLESLETQLSSLQVLQQQQQYEREVALAEIENCRKMLIDNLNEYKGKELEVLHEASTFASETVEHNNDLLLPPYPSRPPSIMCLEKEYLSHIPSMHKSPHNGKITIDPMIEASKILSENMQDHVEAGYKNSRKGLGFFITSAAKTMLSVAGVVSMLSLFGFVPDVGKLSTRLNGIGLIHRQDNEDEISTAQCPPGRMLVVENGEARCIVKERVEVPFSAGAATPGINYGCG